MESTYKQILNFLTASDILSSTYINDKPKLFKQKPSYAPSMQNRISRRRRNNKIANRSRRINRK